LPQLKLGGGQAPEPACIQFLDGIGGRASVPIDVFTTWIRLDSGVHLRIPKQVQQLGLHARTYLHAMTVLVPANPVSPH
ncbi:MAG: hypothetical protein M0P63_08545, partial [Azoarcus sp.]|nr:hypothetical protein [Azoarcus sp.]